VIMHASQMDLPGVPAYVPLPDRAPGTGSPPPIAPHSRPSVEPPLPKR
jgi:hypothetical protein